MKKPPPPRGPNGNAELRQNALKRLATRKAQATKIARGDEARVLQEMQVQQVELEIQNEELRRIRAEVESGLKRFTEIFEFAPIGYCVIGVDGVVQEANIAVARLLERDRSRLIGQGFSRFVVEAKRAEFNAFLGRVLTNDFEEQTSETCELGLVAAGAGQIDARLTASLVGGAPPLALVAIEDVTARKRAEASLVEEAHNKDQFLAVLSHELRNPLAPIRTGLYVLERATPGSEQARRAQATVHRQASHLARIVDDLLDMTRIAQGKIRLQRERLELGQLVRRTVEDHRPEFEGLGIHLGLSESSEPLWLNADATRLVQVLENLLGNAAKFTPREGRVHVSIHLAAGQAAISVKDTGAGISADLRNKLFKPFVQAPQTLDRPRGGLGLGLAMVKGLVELHEGVVDFSSEGPGRGAEFTVRLPLATVQQRREAAQASHVGRRQLQVLVVEDNRDAAEMLRDLLDMEGHVVRVAYSGPEGLDTAKDLVPDVLICDVGLPGMDGYRVAKAFRADPRLQRTYLIALSGYALPDDVHRALEAGFDRHIAKPPSIEGLEQALRDVPAPAVDAPVPTLH